jgi:hypothetical protein
VWVENRSDELWLGVKGQSNLRIAGSLRNSFRASLEQIAYGGRATVEDRGASRLLYLNKLRIPYALTRESVRGG